jgi:hypothetical protein
MSRNIGLQVLQAKLRGFQAAGSSIAHRISRMEKERKNELWNEKRRLGVHCRYHQVAYGLLRGVPYERIERCAPNNQLDPKRVLDIVLAHFVWDMRPTTQKFDLERVTSLLTPSIVAVEPAVANVRSLPTTAPCSSMLEPTSAAGWQPLLALRKLLEKCVGS